MINMVELRKRKEAPPAPAPAAKKERKTKTQKDLNGDKAVAESPVAEASSAKEDTAPAIEKNSSKGGPPKVGDSIDLEGFGGELEDHDGNAVTLKALVEQSKSGVVLFTYPKASTPGCTFHA